MAEAVLFTLTNDILKLAGSITYSKIQLVRGVRDELDNLKETVDTIRVVLLDAEKKRWHDEEVEKWLRKLKDVLYDVQDLLDDVATEDLRREVIPSNKMWKAVRVFFSKSNQLARRLKVANEIQGLWKKLDKIKNDREFHLDKHPSEESMAIVGGKKPENLSPGREIIGREEDKEEIKRLLFDSSSSQSVSSVAIVGKGGLGKTALARLVYNDGEVEEHFGPDKMWWVRVSDVFNKNLIIKQILELSKCQNLGNTPEDRLQSLLSTKKYLLVLDDLWNEDPLKWLNLEEWLKGGPQGSKILVTTRSHEVAKVAKSVIHNLRGLSPDKSSDLFRKLASPSDPELEQMGQNIVTKCAGVPLAIRTIGSLLCGKNKDEWHRYKGEEFPEIPEIDAVDEGIMRVLKLSYDHLPSSLKHCFAYCSLFQKGHVYEADMMIHLWMAQGFIEPYKGKDNEEAAEIYLSELICRSFLEVKKTIKYGDVNKVKKFKMHDLMHDLARKVAGGECKIVNFEGKVAGGECKIVNFEGGDNDRGIRHASFISRTFSKEKVQFLLKTSKLRTFLSLKEDGESSVRNYHKVFSSCGHCRALYLDHIDIPLPPSSLGKLKKLRFLHIFMNQSIQGLPDSVTDLVNLQTLKLSSCEHLQTFPRDLRKLIKLRHLLICRCESLSQLPPLSELPSLKTLRLKSLNALKFIQQTSDPKPSNTTLPFFQSLKSLEVVECIELKGWWGRMREMDRSENSWPSFPKLCFMRIFNCPRLLSLIPSFPQVEYLLMDGINVVVQQSKGNPNCCPKLRYLNLCNPNSRKLRYLQSCGGDGYPALSMLEPLLHPVKNLEYMTFVSLDLRILTRGMQHFSLLKELHIWDCCGTSSYYEEDKDGTQWKNLKNLRVLTIGSIYDMKTLPEGIQYVTNLQSLHILNMPYLICLPKWIGNLSSLEELELLVVINIREIPSEVLNHTGLKKLTIGGCSALDRRKLHNPIIDWKEVIEHRRPRTVRKDDES